MKPKRPYSQFIKNPNGTDYWKVFLAKDKGYALVDNDDYQRLRALGISMHWYAHPNGKGNFYVYTNFPGGHEIGRGPISVARLIADAAGGQRVRHTAGHPFDLRKGAISRCKGNGKSSALDVVLSGADAVAANINTEPSTLNKFNGEAA